MSVGVSSSVVPMNVLFLDIDGVLNSRATARKHGSYCIDPILSGRSNALVEAAKQLSSFPRHIDCAKRRVAAFWRPASYLRAGLLIFPHKLVPMKLQAKPLSSVSAKHGVRTTLLCRGMLEILRRAELRIERPVSNAKRT